MRINWVPAGGVVTDSNLQATRAAAFDGHFNMLSASSTAPKARQVPLFEAAEDTGMRECCRAVPPVQLPSPNGVGSRMNGR